MPSAAYFKRMESWHEMVARGRPPSGRRHRTARCTVKPCPRETRLFEALLSEAGKQAGYEATDDYNGKKQERLWPEWSRRRKGCRWSAANALSAAAAPKDR